MNARLRSLFTRFPPVRWFRAAEDALFRVASEAEYRLKIMPRGTKLVPSTFDRRIVRLLLIIVPVLIATLFIGRSLRLRVLFGILVLAALALAFIFVADAFPAKKSSPPPRPPARPPSARPPARRP